MEKIVLVFILLFASGVWAQNKPQVLDFEGEVIEGERKRPDLFLQLSSKDLNSDSLLFIRKNFNDFLEVDHKTRNRYFRLKGR